MEERRGEEPGIVAVGHALGAHAYAQEALIEALQALWTRHHHNPRRLERFHRAVQVEQRHLAMPLAWYLEGGSDFGRANSAFLQAGTALGEEAVRAALGRAGIKPEEVDALFFTTVTGVATPTIDARLVEPLGLRPDVAS